MLALDRKPNGVEAPAGRAPARPEKAQRANPLWFRLATRSAADGIRMSMPADPSERQAERTAGAVMRMPASASALRSGAGAGPTVPAGLLHGGEPLPDSARRFFEPRFGQDLSGVRVHADAEAERAAGVLGAQAFTVGDHIAFGRGRYVPESDATRRLLAHELAHVVQQRTDLSGPAIHRQPEPAATPGPTLMMAKPPHFPQDPLGCWASAIASWYRVKGFADNVTDKTLLEHYKGTDCIDDKGALIGDNDADMEAVFAEWRLLLKISDEVPDDKFTFPFVKRLIENHGHFLLVTRDKSLMHAMVVYGARWDDRNDPSNFTLFLEDPMAEDNERHVMFVERPIRVALGTERSAGPAPCRSRTPR